MVASGLLVIPSSTSCHPFAAASLSVLIRGSKPPLLVSTFEGTCDRSYAPVAFMSSAASSGGGVSTISGPFFPLVRLSTNSVLPSRAVSMSNLGDSSGRLSTLFFLQQPFMCKRRATKTPKQRIKGEAIMQPMIIPAIAPDEIEELLD